MSLRGQLYIERGWVRVFFKSLTWETKRGIITSSSFRAFMRENERTKLFLFSFGGRLPRETNTSIFLSLGHSSSLQPSYLGVETYWKLWRLLFIHQIQEAKEFMEKEANEWRPFFRWLVFAYAKRNLQRYNEFSTLNHDLNWVLIHYNTGFNFLVKFVLSAYVISSTL